MTPTEKAELEERAPHMKSINISAPSILAILERVDEIMFPCAFCEGIGGTRHRQGCDLRYTILKLKEETPQPEPGGYLATLEREKGASENPRSASDSVSEV